MTLITWKDHYSVGVAALDHDHKILVDLINQLHSAYAAGKGAEELEVVFEVLMEYTVHHFEREETLMRTHGFPGLAPHVEEHRKLRAQVVTYHQQYQERHEGGFFLELLAFLDNWLVLHILDTDMAFRGFFLERGVTLAPVDDIRFPDSDC